MLQVFKLGPFRNNPFGAGEATRELNAQVDNYLSDKPGLLVARMGNLYFHLLPDGQFVVLLPVMFAMANITTSED